MTEHAHEPHAALSLGVDQRHRYLLAVAAIVYADGNLDPGEREVLRLLARVLELEEPEAWADSALKQVRDPDRARIDEILGELQTEELRHALLADAILVAFADGRVTAGECREVAEYAERLGVSTAQAVAVGRYVEEVILGEEGHTLSKALAVGLADAKAELSPPRGLRWLYRKLTDHHQG
jgi:uncharacterized tellurite resistance protein B-like protein